MSTILAVVIFLLGMATGAAVVAATDIGPWFLSIYARAHGGTWHQSAFLCPGCSQRHHVGRAGPTGATLCTRCAPPSTGGAR